MTPSTAKYLAPKLTFVGNRSFDQVRLPPLPQPVADVEPIAHYTFGGAWTGEFRIPSNCSSTAGDLSRKYGPGWVFEATSPEDEYAGIRIERSTLVSSSSIPVQGKATAEDNEGNNITAPIVDTAGAVWGLSEQGYSTISEDRRVIAFSGISFNHNTNGSSPIESFSISGTITCAEPMPADLPTSWEQVPW